MFLLAFVIEKGNLQIKCLKQNCDRWERIKKYYLSTDFFKDSPIFLMKTMSGKDRMILTVNRIIMHILAIYRIYISAL